MGWNPFKPIIRIFNSVVNFVVGIIGGLIGIKQPAFNLPTQDNPGVKQRTPIDAGERTPVVYGRQAWKGQLHHVFARSSPNDIGYYVIRLSEALDSNFVSSTNFINDVYIEENKIQWSATYPRPSVSTNYQWYSSGISNVTDLSGATISDFNNAYTITFVTDGFFGNYKDILGTWSAGYSVADDDPWFKSTTNNMSAYTYAVVGIGFRAQKNIVGLSDMTFFVENGCSNPGYAIYDYLISARYGCGGELSNADINVNGSNFWSISNAIAYCNTIVTNIDPITNQSTTGVLYRIDYLLNTNKDRWSNLQEMARSMGGVVRQSVITGLVEIVYDRPQTSLFSVDDSYYLNGLTISQKDINLSPTLIEVSYARNDTIFKNQEDTFTIDLTQNSINGKERKANYKFNSVGNAPQANRLASIEVNKSMNNRLFEFDADARLYGLETGDVITLSSEVNGLNSQLVRILQIDTSINNDGFITMQFLCEAYSVAAVTANTVIQQTPALVPSNKSPRALANFTPIAPITVDPLKLVDLGGLQIQATVPEFNTTNIIFRYRVSGGNTYTQIADVFSSNLSGFFDVGQNVQATFPRIAPNNYLVSYLLSNGNISSNWSDELLLNYFPGNLQFTQRYLILRYADSFSGLNITTNPLNKRFLGLYNSFNNTSNNDPTLYIWYDLITPLSLTNRIYFRNLGNRQVNLTSSTTALDTQVWSDLYEAPNPLNPVLDLDSITGFVVKGAYTAGGSNYLTSVVGVDGTVTFLLPNGTAVPGNTPIGSIASINVDQQGRVSGFTATDKIYVTITEFTATTSNQTFTFSHIAGQALVFLDGVLLDPTEYTEASGTPSPSITIPGSFNGATVVMIRFTESNSAGTITYVPFTRSNINTVIAQTTYSATFAQGSELIFLNGVFLHDIDYSYSGGINSFTLNNAPLFANNLLTLVTFRIFNNNAVPFSQAAGSTLANNNLITLSGNVGPIYTLLFQNGVSFSPSDFSIVTGQAQLTTNALFTGQAVQTTTYAASGAAMGASSFSEEEPQDPSANELFPIEPAQLTIDERFDDLQQQINQLRN